MRDQMAAYELERLDTDRSGCGVLLNEALDQINDHKRTIRRLVADVEAIGRTVKEFTDALPADLKTGDFTVPLGWVDTLCALALQDYPEYVPKPHVLLHRPATASALEPSPDKAPIDRKDAAATSKNQRHGTGRDA